MAELRTFCQSTMTDYKVPRHFQVVETFPLTATNKIQRYVLTEQAVRLLETL